MAKRIKKNEFAGKGCAVQGLGLLLPFICAVFGITGFLVGLLLMVLCLVVGDRMSVKWSCGECSSPLEDNTAPVCPACKAQFE